MNQLDSHQMRVKTLNSILVINLSDDNKWFFRDSNKKSDFQKNSQWRKKQNPVVQNQFLFLASLWYWFFLTFFYKMSKSGAVRVNIVLFKIWRKIKIFLISDVANMFSLDIK